MVCVTPSRVRTRGWTFGVACRGWIVSVDARVRAYNSADVFDAGIFPSPAVTRCSGGGGGGEEKRRKDLFLDNREHGVSADKRIFRLTTRDHILQLMRLDLTPRYSSRNSSPSYFLRRYSVLISRSKASLLQSFSFFLSNCLVTSFEICFEKRKRKNCFPSSFLIA